jgi:preprotein translocase subunit SecE
MLQKIKDFFKEVKIELKKVVFPSRDEILGSTWVVIFTVLVSAVFLGLVDLWLSKLVRLAIE